MISEACRTALPQVALAILLSYSSAKLQQLLDIFFDVFWFGCRRIAFDNIALAIDQKLREVPLDACSSQNARCGFGEVLKKRVGVTAVDINFFKQREGNTIARFTKRLNFVRAARLLPAKLIAGKAQHRKALICKLRLELLKTLILRRKSALAGSIHNQQHFIFEVTEGDRISFDAGSRKVVDRW